LSEHTDIFQVDHTENTINDTLDRNKVTQQIQLGCGPIEIIQIISFEKTYFYSVALFCISFL